MTRPTPYTKAADIAADLSARLGRISVANGFNTDIGARTYRGRRHVDQEHVPCSALVEGDDDVDENQGIQNIKVAQEYVLGGYAKCDPDNPNDTAHLIIRDLKRAVFSDGMRLGDRVRTIVYLGRGIGPRADGADVVFAVIYIRVEYAEDLTNP